METLCRRFLAKMMAACMLVNTVVFPVSANITFADTLPAVSDQDPESLTYFSGEKATASDAEENKDHQHSSSSETGTASDALYDEDGFLLDGDVADDIPEEMLLQGNTLLSSGGMKLPDQIIEGEETIILEGIEGPEVIWGDMSDLIDWDSNELLQDYFERQLMILKGGSESRGMLRAPRAGRLSGNDAAVYAYAKEKLEQVAAGQLDYSKFDLSLTLFNIPGYDETENTLTITEADVGYPLISDGGLSPEADAYVSNLKSMASFDAGLVTQALLADCPYDFYWASKKYSYINNGFGYRGGYIDDSGVTLTDIILPNIGYEVDSDFLASGGDDFTADTEKTGAAAAAAVKAGQIVEEAEYRSDYQKLVYYRNSICDLTAYNTAAQNAGNSVNYGTAGPWQVFYVFDENENTNVVCEGYSKAFKYLCDLTDFNSSDIECSLVTGTLGAGTGAGGHMWNVVHMNDGQNYLVDVTNCDTGSIGNPDKLFLRGYTTQTTDSSGRQTGYVIKANRSNVPYTYDSDTLDLFSDSETTLPGTDYADTTISVTGVSLSQTTADLEVGDAVYLIPQIYPNTATNKEVTWSSSDSSVVSVDNTGLVTSLKAGTAVITVTTNDGGYTATCTVTVSERVYNVTSVSLNITTKTVTEGDSFTLAATVLPENATNKNVTWSSSDSTVATVDQSGKVTAVKAGTATITVTTEDGGKTATCAVTVEAKVYPVTGVTLDQTAKTVTEGDSFTLAATVAPANATNKNVSWSSSDSTVATVDQSGKVTAVKAGTATITVTTEDGNKTAACVVTVNSPEDKIDTFIKRLYRVCLDREADAGGLNYWGGRVRSGELKGIALAGSFAFSKEFTGKNYCNEHFVRQLYKALMGREADAGGLNHWAGLLESGTTREAVLNSFASSNEYRELCSAAGIELGSKIKEPEYGTQQYGPCAVCGEKSKVVQFVERMYTECLKRSADSSGLTYWSKELCNHTKTGKSLLDSFFLSEEIRKKNLSNEEYVRRIYRAMLNREPDSGGLNYWVGELNKGKQATAVIAGFVNSKEFTNICDEYGIVRK